MRKPHVDPLRAGFDLAMYGMAIRRCGIQELMEKFQCSRPTAEKYGRLLCERFGFRKARYMAPGRRGARATVVFLAPGEPV